MATSQQQVLFGSMESIFRDAVVPLQRGRSQGVVGMGIMRVMVLMAVVCAAVIWPVAVVVG